LDTTSLGEYAPAQEKFVVHRDVQPALEPQNLPGNRKEVALIPDLRRGWTVSAIVNT